MRQLVCISLSSCTLATAQGLQGALLGGASSATAPLLDAERVGMLGTEVVAADRACLQLQPLRPCFQGELVAVADAVSKVCGRCDTPFVVTMGRLHRRRSSRVAVY